MITEADPVATGVAWPDGTGLVVGVVRSCCAEESVWLGGAGGLLGSITGAPPPVWVKVGCPAFEKITAGCTGMH